MKSDDRRRVGSPALVAGLLVSAGQLAAGLRERVWWRAAVPLADFLKLTQIPIVLEYSDGIPSTPSPFPRVENWRNRLILCRMMADALNRRGGDATVLHLPEVGIHGNTHFSFADMNNVQVADLLSRFLREKRLDKRGESR
jgi:hypothetical protein